ncbi:MAG: hypothetical protein IPK82_13800 [Polyangiaceae bacterium]|nr:hypothetical protein [Polyangiaceae bacterium]
MSDQEKKRTPLPVDPNVTGAFPGGPEQIPAEAMEQLLKEPQTAEAEFQQRLKVALDQWRTNQA